MISHRHGCAILAAAGCFLGSAVAQVGTGAAAVPRTGESSAFGPSTTPGTGADAAGSAAGGSSAFGTNPPGTGPGAAPETGPGAVPGARRDGTGAIPRTGANGNATGAASAFGEGQTKPPAAAEPSYSIPGAYGRPAQQFTAGEGRLARPRFRYTGSVSFGYDDNVRQTPTHSEGTPDIVVEVLDSPGTPARLETGIGPDGAPITLVVPGAGPTTKKIVIPGMPGQKRIGSFLTRGNVGVDVQFASRKTLFTFDLRTGADWYWDRPGKDVDYTGSLALLYLRRLTPRIQFTTSANASYQTQPDLTQVNTSTRQGGAFLSLTTKMDLTYRMTPRFSTVASVGYSAVRYQEKVQQLGDFGDTTFGLEARYLFSPRFTLLGEVRYSSVSYSTTVARDSHSVFALLGGELALSRRFRATLRLGAAQRTFDESGTNSIAPYAETTLSYQLAKATLIQFNGRYGFEEPPDAGSKLLSMRAGLNLVQSFSPRLRGTLGANVVRQTTTSTLTDTESIINTVDSTIGFEYNLNRHWTLNTNYSYTTGFGSVAASDYYRNRVFVGAEYDF